MIKGISLVEVLVKAARNNFHTGRDTVQGCSSHRKWKPWTSGESAEKVSIRLHEKSTKT